MAWGKQGHRIVGEIADRHLTKAARKNIQQILGNESLAMCANWADFIKSDSTFDHLSTWHYNNFKPQLNKETFLKDLHADTTKGAYQAMVWLVNQLKVKSHPPATKTTYLKLLVHLVGDVHQPLHMGQYEDRGGNRIRVRWFRENVNLHDVWDDRLIDYQKLSFTEYANAINFSTPEEVRLWQQQPLTEWAYESYVIGQQIYAEVQSGNNLGYRYNFDNIDTLNKQLLKAGIRLAGLLNEIFG